MNETFAEETSFSLICSFQFPNHISLKHQALRGRYNCGITFLFSSSFKLLRRLYHTIPYRTLKLEWNQTRPLKQTNTCCDQIHANIFQPNWIHFPHPFGKEEKTKIHILLKCMIKYIRSHIKQRWWCAFGCVALWTTDGTELWLMSWLKMILKFN